LYMYEHTSFPDVCATPVCASGRRIGGRRERRLRPADLPVSAELLAEGTSWTHDPRLNVSACLVRRELAYFQA